MSSDFKRTCENLIVNAILPSLLAGEYVGVSFFFNVFGLIVLGSDWIQITADLHLIYMSKIEVAFWVSFWRVV